MRTSRSEWPLYAAVFLDLFGFGMIVSDIQLRAQALVPEGFPKGATIGALLAFMFIVQFLVSPKWGVYSDHAGRKKVLIICTALSGLAMLTYGVATSLWMLFASRLLAGLGGANVAIAQAYIADTHEGESRTAALGRVGAAISLGLIVGPPLGGVIVHSFGHHVLGYVAGAASLLGVLWIAIELPHKTTPKPREPETRKIIDLRLLNDLPHLRPLVLIAIVAWLSLATLEGTFARLIKLMLGYDQLEFGFLFGYEAMLGFAIQALLLAWLTKRYKDAILLRSAYVSQGVGLALNPLAGTLAAFVPGLATLFVASTLFALGSSVANPTVNGLCSKLTPDSRQGELFGLLQGTRSIGFVLGPILGGAMFDFIPAAPYYFAGGVCLLAAVLVPKLD